MTVNDKVFLQERIKFLENQRYWLKKASALSNPEEAKRDAASIDQEIARLESLGGRDD